MRGKYAALTCFGWKERRGTCERKPNPLLPSPAEGRSEHWCPECQRARIAHLNEQFAKIEQMMRRRQS